MSEQSRPRPDTEQSPSAEEIARRRAWVARKQADPEFMAKVREAIASLDRGEGVPWEVVKRELAEREAARKRKGA